MTKAELSKITDTIIDNYPYSEEKFKSQIETIMNDIHIVTSVTMEYKYHVMKDIRCFRAVSQKIINNFQSKNSIMFNNEDRVILINMFYGYLLRLEEKYKEYEQKIIIGQTSLFEDIQNRESDIWLKQHYPELYKKLPEFISRGYIKRTEAGYDWNLQANTFGNLFSSNNYGKSFCKQILCYFTFKGKKKNPNSIKQTFSRKIPSKEFSKVKAILPDITLY